MQCDCGNFHGVRAGGPGMPPRRFGGAMHKAASDLSSGIARSCTATAPVRDFLRSLPVDDRHRIGHDLTLVQYGWPVGMPLCRSLGGGLWELRSSLPSRRIARILFFVHEDRIRVVHGFIKKTQRTPPADLVLARERMRDMLT